MTSSSSLISNSVVSASGYVDGATLPTTPRRPPSTTTARVTTNRTPRSTTSGTLAPAAGRTRSTPRVQRSCRNWTGRGRWTTTTEAATTTTTTANASTYSTLWLGPDRFIPDRNYVDTPRARRALVSQDDSDDDDEDPRDDLPMERHSAHEQQLRRVLFAADVDSPPTTCKKRKKYSLSSSSSSSLLGLGHHHRRRRTRYDAHHGTATTFHPTPNPMSLDILRSPWRIPPQNDNTDFPPLPVVSTARCFTLGVDGIDPRDDLHVISAGPPGVAVAMWDTVGFNNPNFDCLTMEDMGNLTALQWRSSSHDDATLAVGGERSLQVWDMTKRVPTTTEVTDPYTHSITALEWMTNDDSTTSTCSGPWGLLASTLSGIQLYDLRLRYPHVFMYDTSRRAMNSTTSSFVNHTHHHTHQQQAAKLQLQPDGGWMLAAALPRCNKVALWDLRRSNLPFQTMEHASVKGMQFCPMHRNSLATGGADGIRLWNVQSGGERLHAPTVAPVTTLTWSLDRTEFMAGFGDHLGVYQTTSDFTKIRKLEQWTQPRVGPVVAVERMHGENARRVLSVHSESVIEPGSGEAMVCWEPFPRTATAARTRKNDLRRHSYGDNDLRHTTLACSPVVR